MEIGFYGVNFKSNISWHSVPVWISLVLNNFIKNRLTEKSSDLRLVLFKGQPVVVHAPSSIRHRGNLKAIHIAPAGLNETESAGCRRNVNGALRHSQHIGVKRFHVFYLRRGLVVARCSRSAKLLYTGPG